MNTKSGPAKLVVLGWLYILTTGMMVAVGGVWYLALEMFATAFSSVTFQHFLDFTELLGVSFFIIMALPSLVAGLALLRRKTWAKPLALAVAVLSLVNFPLGTAVGCYTFWVMSDRHATSPTSLKAT